MVYYMVMVNQDIERGGIEKIYYSSIKFGVKKWKNNVFFTVNSFSFLFLLISLCCKCIIYNSKKIIIITNQNKDLLKSLLFLYQIIPIISCWSFVFFNALGLSYLRGRKFNRSLQFFSTNEHFNFKRKIIF